MSARRLVVVALVAVLSSSCGGPSFYSDGRFRFYDVERARSEECAIRANGEFCVEPEQFDPPVTEVWTVDLNDDISTLYVDEEVWVLDPLPDGPTDDAPRTASRRSIVTDGDTGCTTTRLRDISFVSDEAGLTGTMRESQVLQGPASCGDTPAGQRSVDTLTGFAGGP